MKDWLSCDIVMFKIEVGVDAKCTLITRKMATTACNIACSCRYSLSPFATHTAAAGIILSVDIHATARYSKISRSVCVLLCVCRKVYCGKMAEWIRITFGIVSGVSRMMGVLDGW